MKLVLFNIAVELHTCFVNRVTPGSNIRPEIDYTDLCRAWVFQFFLANDGIVLRIRLHPISSHYLQIQLVSNVT
jgi:hypothetical protein